MSPQSKPDKTSIEIKVLNVIVTSIQTKGLDPDAPYSELLEEASDQFVDEDPSILEDVMEYIKKCRFLKTIIAMDMDEFNQLLKPQKDAIQKRFL